MGQGDSSPSGEGSGLAARRPRRKHSRVAFVFNGSKCDGGAPEPRRDRDGRYAPRPVGVDAGGGGGGDRFVPHRRSGPTPRHFNPHHLPTTPVHCTPDGRTGESNMQQALQEETAWQQQQQCPFSVSTRVSANEPVAPAKAAGGVGRSATVAENPLPAAPRDQTDLAATSERHWWLMICEDLIATARLRRQEAAAETARTVVSPIALTVQQAIREAVEADGAAVSIVTNASAAEEGVQRGPRTASPLKAMASGNRLHPPPSWNPAVPGAPSTRHDSSQQPLPPPPRFLTWCDYPQGRSTGVDYFILATTTPRQPQGGRAGDCAAPIPPPLAEPPKASRNSNGSSNASGCSAGDEKPASHPSAPGITGDASVTSNISEPLPGSAAHTDGADNAPPPMPVPTAPATPTEDASNAATNRSGCCSPVWQAPPPGLRELPVGPTYFAVLRRAWSTKAAPAAEDSTHAEPASNPLGRDMAAAPAKLSATGSGCSQPSSSRAFSRAESARNMSSTDGRSTEPASSTSYARPGGRRAGPPSTSFPSARISDDELHRLILAHPNAAVSLPSVSVTQMLRVLSPDWVNEGLYDAAGIRELSCVRELAKARRAKEKKR